MEHGGIKLCCFSWFPWELTHLLLLCVFASMEFSVLGLIQFKCELWSSPESLKFDLSCFFPLSLFCLCNSGPRPTSSKKCLSVVHDSGHVDPSWAICFVFARKKNAWFLNIWSCISFSSMPDCRRLHDNFQEDTRNTASIYGKDLKVLLITGGRKAKHNSRTKISALTRDYQKQMSEHPNFLPEIF